MSFLFLQAISFKFSLAVMERAKKLLTCSSMPFKVLHKAIVPESASAPP